MRGKLLSIVDRQEVEKKRRRNAAKGIDYGALAGFAVNAE